jgi:hypothetical protein
MRLRIRREGSGDDPAARLIAAGFLAYADPADAEQLKRRLSRRPDVEVFADESRRFHVADAEDLAEGDVGEFVTGLAPTLLQMGVASLEVEDDFRDDGSGYDVTVNGRRYSIWSEADDVETTWGRAAARTVRIVNDLLTDAGSPERAWGYAGGNDFGVFESERRKARPLPCPA